MKEKSSPEFIYCRDFIKEFSLRVSGCCASCHEDHEQYGYDLLEYELPNNRIAHVCCIVANAYDNKEASNGG